ncbi:MAG: InlB B-repeat-containing protein [Bacilli bacterium]|nr:InlB B-repeat-containing protein [Bacilli bacterium]
MPTREGYDFAGWFTSKTGGKKITENSRAEDNLIIYAQWKQKAIINPLTGIATPVIGLMLITIASFAVYMFIKNKNMNLE